MPPLGIVGEVESLPLMLMLPFFPILLKYKIGIFKKLLSLMELAGISILKTSVSASVPVTYEDGVVTFTLNDFGDL